VALPTSGPLSFSMIAGELGTETPNSLRAMSSAVGFSEPDAVSEFYGYGPGGSLTLFFITSGTNASGKVCAVNPPCCTAAWHNGANALPDLGDIVYTDSAGTTPLSPFKSNVFFGMDVIECELAYTWFKISVFGDGEVVDLSGCL
jgi:hypothetical protein